MYYSDTGKSYNSNFTMCWQGYHIIILYIGSCVKAFTQDVIKRNIFHSVSILPLM